MQARAATSLFALLLALSLLALAVRPPLLPPGSQPSASPPPNLGAEFLPLPPMNGVEREGFEAMQAELAASIQKGVEFVANPPPAKK